MLATEYAKYYELDPQGENESDLDFRDRISGTLRDMGHIIEAHEVHHNERYEQSDDVMTGVIGAVTQALQGVDYGSRGSQQVGDDIAAGAVTRYRKEQMSPEMALLMIELFGK